MVVNENDSDFSVSSRRRVSASLRRSVFWRVALVLVGVQVATGWLAVALSAWFAYDRSRELVANSLRVQLDRLAEEVEERGAPLRGGLGELPPPLRLDLARRFPDPVWLLDPGGRVLATVAPDAEAFAGGVTAPDTLPALEVDLALLLQDGEIVVEVDRDAPDGGWGLAPVYDADGFLAGGLLVRPLAASIDRELAGTRAAYVRAIAVVGAVAAGLALLLGALFTWRLVRPLRRMTRQVERIGAGDYGARMADAADDEFGRLAAAINRMADAVAESIERLRATDALRRELVANVGHDLRTPLAALLGYLEEAGRLQQAGDPGGARAALDTAARQGAYLRQLVDDLFELSVLDTAAAPPRREPIPLGELLHDAAGRHRAAFEKDGIAFEADLPAALPVLEGDGVRLLRVLDNLLGNARRHTPPGGTVRLAARRVPGAVEVTVADTGHGMTADEVERIFDRYYRGADARTRGAQGTGLGLAISRAIARAHGGDLTARSTPGEGSTFCLRLPLDAP